MKPYLSLIDTATTGNRYDVTPLFRDAGALGQLVADLAGPFAGSEIDAVACIDALGFVLGTAIAVRLGVGVVLLRKGGKLPVACDGVDFRDYSGEAKRLELRSDAVQPGDRLLLVDEWIETAAQVRAAVELLERRGGAVVGIASICMDDNEATQSLRKAYRCHKVWDR